MYNMSENKGKLPDPEGSCLKGEYGTGKVFIVTFSDGSEWSIPVDVIARYRAADYATIDFGGDVERSMRKDTLPLFQEHDDEIGDYAIGNMNWSDVSAYAVKTGQKQKQINFQDEWLSCDHRVEKVDKGDMMTEKITEKEMAEMFNTMQKFLDFFTRKG